MTDRFEGDPKMILDAEGADLVFHGGQPVMDAGLENAALISLHTREGWCGNILMRRPEERIGSKFEQALEQPITLSALNVVRHAAIAALQWMLDVKLASRVDAIASNPNGRTVKTVVAITPPSSDPFALLLTRNGVNWISQVLDPANLRV